MSVATTIRAVTTRTPLEKPTEAMIAPLPHRRPGSQDRKSTRLNSSHLVISYAVFCLKKKLFRLDLHRLHSVNSFPSIRNRAPTLTATATTATVTCSSFILLKTRKGSSRRFHYRKQTI